jgi:hypothetical protein
MVDALAPALAVLTSGNFAGAAKAAAAGAESTKAMRKAKAGRASYVGRRIWRGCRIRELSLWKRVRSGGNVDINRADLRAIRSR